MFVNHRSIDGDFGREGKLIQLLGIMCLFEGELL